MGISGAADKADPMHRPHIRFNGTALAENKEFWNHKQILARIELITGPIGIRRYNGDSYWCKDYKELTGKEATKAYTDEEMKARDELVKPGEEAQWCIFDPIVSVIYGKYYQKTRDKSDLQTQHYFLCRSLAQITKDWLCPESYYLCKDAWVPSDICPLLWTKANLQVALKVMQDS